MAAVGVDLVVIAALFLLAFALTFEGARARLLQWAQAFAARYGRPEHTPEWELEHAELWLMARRTRLQEHLRRVEMLLRHDEHMSATRQIGNRMARDQLIASLARIPDVLPGQGRHLTHSFRRAEPSASAYEISPRPATRSTVEVLDVSGWR